MRADVGVCSARYKIFSSVHREENTAGEPRITGNLYTVKIVERTRARCTNAGPDFSRLINPRGGFVYSNLISRLAMEGEGRGINGEDGRITKRRCRRELRRLVDASERIEYVTRAAALRVTRVLRAEAL